MEIKIPEEEVVETQSLKADDHNPNRMTQAQRNALKKSIQKYGFLIPIITNKDLLIADGQQRWEVAKDMGLKQVKIVRLPMEEVDRRILRQVLNKLRGEHQPDLDIEEYKRIFDEGRIEDLGSLVPDINITSVMDHIRMGHEEETDVKEIIERDPKYKVIQGDVWKLGDHRLLCGDAQNEAHVATLMDGAKANVAFTDPPYNVDYTGMVNSKEWKGIKNDAMKTEDFITFLKKALQNIYSFSSDTAALYLCHADKTHVEFRKAFEETGYDWRATLIWCKSGPAYNFAQYKYKHEPIFYLYKQGKKVTWYGDNTQHTLWLAKKEVGDHPTIKPTDLIERALTNNSKPGEIILDLFGGSGSTLIAAEKLKRKCCIMEIDPKYCSVIIERWEEYSGSKGEKQ